MALGNEGGNGSFKVVKLMSTKGPTTEEPKFFLEKKEGDKYILDGDGFSFIEGVIEEITTTHNGKTGHDEVKGFKVIISDGDEKYRLDSTMKHASKDIANVSLANIGKRVKFSLYLNKGGYPSVSSKYEDGSYAEDFFKFSMEAKGNINSKGDVVTNDDIWNEIKGKEPATTEDLPF